MLLLKIQLAPQSPVIDLCIDVHLVSFGNHFLKMEDIQAIRFGFWDKPKVGTAYTFIFKDQSGNEAKLEFDLRYYPKMIADGLYWQIENAIIEYYGHAVMAQMHETLKSGGTVKTATCQVSKQGIHFKTATWLGTKAHFVAWDDLGFADSPTLCHVLMGSKTDKAARLDFNLGGEWQGQFLYRYLQNLRKSPTMLADLQP
jgi:hypothetical protein